MDNLEQLRHSKECLRHYREIHSKASEEAARFEGWLRTHTATIAALIKSAPDQELDLNADSRNDLMQYWKAKYAEACRKRKVTASQLSQAQNHRDKTRQEMFKYVEIVFDLERQIEKEANKGKSHETDFRFQKARQDDKQDGSDQEETPSRRGSISSQSESEIFQKDRNRSKSRKYWKAYQQSKPQPQPSQQDGDRSKPQNDRKPEQQSTPQPKPSQKDGDRSETRNNWKPPRPSTPHPGPKPFQKSRKLAPFNHSSTSLTQILFLDRVKEWYQQTTEVFPRYHELTAFPAPPVQGHCAKLSCRQNPGALAPACRCSIRAAFGLVPDLDLKKERTRWHPDKFSGCAEALREDFQQKAKEIFVVVEEMYDEAQKGRS